MRRLAPCFAALALSALSACSSSGAPDPAPATADAGPEGPNAVPEWDRPVTPPADSEAEAKRASCGYAKGALPAETQGASHPTGSAIPIDTIVIAMMENRSFDHYFQKIREHGHPDVDVAPADFSNPGPDGAPVTIHRDTRLCFVDTAHGWSAVHAQVGDSDAMDGFVRTNEGAHELPIHGTPDMLSGARAMTYYEKEDLPFMYWAADQFAIGDRYFCSVLGPTWPNRMYLYAGSSFGRSSNKIPDGVEATLFDLLEKRGISWKIYAARTPGAAMFVDAILKYNAEHVFPGEQFFEDAKAGTLPQVVLLDPQIAGEDWDQNDEHPPAVMQFGQQWLASVSKALIESPQWSRSALFVTYDEHGGLYDHVPPPKACPPDDRAPDGAKPGEGGFDRLGIRVPFAVISPFAKKGYVSHRVYDHTSILRFVQARFTLPALSNRDANAEAPWDVFDFASPPNASPGLPPEVPLDEKALAACKAIFE